MISTAANWKLICPTIDMRPTFRYRARAGALLLGISLFPILGRADAYFQIGDAAGNSVIVRVTQTGAIQTAREILAGRAQPMIMVANVVPVPAFYNPGWHFHVDPVTVDFADTAREACDSSISGVEQASSKIGGSTLPDFQWCPYTTKILAEVPAPPDVAQHAFHVSAADSSELALAPGSLAIAYIPIVPDQSGIISLTLRDNSGENRNVLPFFSSPGYVIYQLPDGIAPGLVTSTITAAGGLQYVDSLFVLPFAPSLFAVRPSSLAAAWVTRVKADGATSFEPVFRIDFQTQNVTAVPIDLGPVSDQVYLSLLGTGIRNRTGPDSLYVSLAGQAAAVLYAGPQSLYDGVDQINLLLPRSLAGAGTVQAWIASSLPGPRTLVSQPVHLLFQ